MTRFILYHLEKLPTNKNTWWWKQCSLILYTVVILAFFCEDKRAFDCSAFLFTCEASSYSRGHQSKTAQEVKRLCKEMVSV